MDAATITVVKDGGFFGHPQPDMGNVGLLIWWFSYAFTHENRMGEGAWRTCNSSGWRSVDIIGRVGRTG